MANMLNIYRRECGSYFNSPIAYIVIVAFLLVMSFFFFPFFRFFSNDSPDFRPYFEHILPFGFFSFVIIPAITMRLWAEEKKQGTEELLMTLPFKSWELVLGKFFAGYTIVALALVLTISVPISLAFVVEGLDWGVITMMYIGMFLISGIYVALGAFVSSLTENQIVALLVAAVLSALICFIGFPPVITWLNENLFGAGDYLGRMGTFLHYQGFAKGLLNPVDVVYAVSMTALFVILNGIAVEGRKY